MQELRANTQVVVTIGPFVDVGDGFTPETGITLGAADEAELVKHNTTTGIDISGRTWAVLSTAVDGYYNLTLTTTDTNTEGMLLVVVQDDSVCLPVKAEFMVLSEAAYDSKYVAKDDGFMDVNIKTVGRADTQETEANNLELACANYSATRGLSGTALPAVAADGALGLPISDAGGLDLDAKLANTNEVTAARMATLTDWINGGRLDLILDIIAADVVNLDGDAMRGTNGANTVVPDAAGTAPTAVENRQEMDSNSTELAKVGTIPALDGAGQTIGAAIAKLADDNAGADFDATTDSMQAIRDRGDSAWTTGAGGSDRLLMVDTTIATLASQVSFTLTAGSTDDNAYVNCTIVIEDASTATQKAVGLISAYTGATKTVTLKYDPSVFTMAPTDKVYVLAENALKSTVQNRQIGIDANSDLTKAGTLGSNTINSTTVSDTGAAEIAAAVLDKLLASHTDAGSLGKAVADILTDTVEIGAAGAGLTNINLPNQTMNITGNLSGSAGSVTGAVGSVAAAVVTDAASRIASKADLTTVAKTGADSDTLETLSDQLDGAGGGGDATEAKQDTIISDLSTIRGTDDDTLKIISEQLDGIAGGGSTYNVEIEDRSIEVRTP